MFARLTQKVKMLVLIHYKGALSRAFLMEEAEVFALSLGDLKCQVPREHWYFKGLVPFTWSLQNGFPINVQNCNNSVPFDQLQNSHLRDF